MDRSRAKESGAEPPVRRWSDIPVAHRTVYGTNVLLVLLSLLVLLFLLVLVFALVFSVLGHHRLLS